MNFPQALWDHSLTTAAASILFFASGIAALAQGQLVFSNGINVDAPVYDAAGNRIIGPSPYVAGLFWSSDTNALMDSLEPIGPMTPFANGTNYYGGGYFFGLVTFPFPFGAGTRPLVQVRVWDSTYAENYYDARDRGGEFGFSNPITVVLDEPPGTGGRMLGLQSFQLQRLPDLSVSLTSTNTLAFSWPTNTTVYALEENVGFNASNWVAVTGVPVVVDSRNLMTIAKPERNTFYRLISQ